MSTNQTNAAPTSTGETVKGEVAKKPAEPPIVGLMRDHRERLSPVLPSHIDTDTFIGLAAGAFYRDEDLLAAANANPSSAMNALFRCASLGHQPGTEEFYLHAHKVKGKAAVRGIEGYRGIVERMYRSGAVASVTVREVCHQDQFTYEEGVHQRPIHKVDWFGSGGRGKMIGVYAYAELVTGAVSRVVILNEDDVMAAKASSDGANSDYSPWNRLDAGKDRPEFKGRSMWWKTAARRLEPWVPTSVEYRREIARAAAESAAQAPSHEAAPAAEPIYYDSDTGVVVDAEVVEEADDGN